MQSAASLFIEVTGDVSDAQAAFGQIERDLKNAGRSAEQSGGGFTKMGAAATGAIAGIAASMTQIVGGMILQAPAALIGKLGDAIQLASDKAESASKAAILFGEGMDVIDAAAKNSTTSLGVASGKYLELVGNLGNLVTNFGFAGDEAATMSVDMVQLAADMGSFNNASTEDVTYAMGAAFRGETEPIRKYGVMLDSAAVSAKAVEMGLIPMGGVLDKTSKLAATYQLILEQTTAAQGDFARTSDGYANAQRINAAKQEEAWLRIGEAIKPIAQLLTGLLSEAITGALNLVMGIADAVNGWAEDNKELLTTVSGLVKNGINIAVTAFGTLFDIGKKIIDVVMGPMKPAFMGIAAIMTAMLIPAIIGSAIAFGTQLLTAVSALVSKLTLGLIPALKETSTGMEVSGKSAGVMSGNLAGLTVAGGLLVGGLALINKTQEGTNAEMARGVTVLADWKTGTEDQIAQLRHAAQQLDETAGSTKLLGIFDTDATAAQAALAKQARETADRLEYQNNILLGNTAYAHLARERAEELTGATALLIPAADGATVSLGSLAEQAGLSEEAFAEMQTEINKTLTSLGLDFEMSEGDIEALAARFGVTTETITGQWDSVEAKFAATTQRIRDYIGELPPDFELTNEAMNRMAKLLGVGTDDIEREFNDMRKSVVADVVEMTSDMVGTLKNNKDTVKTAMDNLMWAIEHPMALTKAKARIEAALTSQNMVEGLASNNDGIRIVAEQQRAILVAEWESLTGKAYPGGVRIGETWVEGIAAGITTKKWLVSTKIDNIARMMIGLSPPPEGPLHNVDKGGENVGDAWISGVIASIKSGSLNPALAGVAAQLEGVTARSGLPLFSPQVLTDMARTPVATYPGSSSDSRSGGGDAPVTVNVTVDGLIKAETPADIGRALLRLGRLGFPSDGFRPS